MILAVAALMALGAIAFPIAVDLRKHGADNILVRSGREIVALPLVALPLAWLRDISRKALQALFIIAAIVVVGGLAWLMRILGIL
jgi:hypothetical protein